eukprot:CAMPEP_0115425198 /NCGR_PEP_ID=MMETSP0271-20121206/28251_1 /TAXON_ID=71861 /ORGANISM="Scrippsiella trochoidea, Strain CCMP3099" /LENGTH=340 /DNA_ID=CAMNT_0002850079 /DNA_START=51 /DNA_END=1073 /DNA_ORIENTATION=-
MAADTAGLGAEPPSPTAASPSNGVPDAAEDAKVMQFFQSNGSRRRGSVSAAPVSNDRLAGWQGPPHYAKSYEECVRIRDTILRSPALQVLFGHLSSAGVDQVVGALSMRTFQVNDIIIQQGADGDYFYIVDSGTYDIYVQRGADLAPERVMVATAGMSFGELALMYNVPRAASVVCSEQGGLWCLDRECFQMMLVTAENTKHREYEGFLAQIPVLSALNRFELARVSDLLSTELFDDGEDIVTQGEEGDAVYFLYEGECRAYMTGEQGMVEVKHYTFQGEYFGEIALINNEPRRATVRACGEGCVVLKLKKEDVDLSVGAICDRLRENIGLYQQYEAYVR